MSSQREFKAEPPSSEAPLPSSPSPVRAQAGKIDQANASKDMDSTMNETKTSQPTTIPSHLSAKHTNLKSHLASLQLEKSNLISRSTTIPIPETWTQEDKSKAALSTAQARIKEHISLLHSYNEIKDIGLGLLGLLAEGRGVRVKDLMGEFEMGEKD
ncbi:hypothetical protein AC579_2515 [Pseudocercospora musae]|uniref:Swi5-domain-containing protein n=1 Tax=Pseudocercospora musae TaxID=113226 RepID=A0A139GV87_9PEZI|nr:hypothetical protein AC579_2515 [Pseudocercospora musae]